MDPDLGHFFSFVKAGGDVEKPILKVRVGEKGAKGDCSSGPLRDLPALPSAPHRSNPHLLLGFRIRPF